MYVSFFSFLQWSMVPWFNQYLLYVFPDIFPCSQHQLITVIHSFPAYAHSHSVLIKCIIHISADRFSILSSFTLSCCFNSGAVLICHVAGNSHLCILLHIFHTLQPTSSIFHLKIQSFITSLSTMHSFLRRAFLVSLSGLSICFWLKSQTFRA